MSGHDIILRVVGDVQGALRGLKDVREAVQQTGKATETTSVQVKAAAERNIASYAAQREKLQLLAGEYRAAARSATSSAKEQEAAAILATRATERLATMEGRASRQAREHTISLGGVTKGLLGVAGAYVGATGLLSVGEKGLELFGQQQKAAAELHSEFGRGERQIESWSKTTASSIFVAQGQAMEMTAEMGKMLEGMGLAPRKVRPMSEALVELASKVAFLRGKDPEQVLNMFEAGLAGRGRALKQLGFYLDDVTLKAKAMQLGIVTAGRDQEKIAILTDRMAVNQAKYAAAVAKYGQSSVQAHSAGEALASTHAKLAKAVEGTVPKLNAEQKAIAANAVIMQQGKSYLEAFNREHGKGAGQLAEYRAEVKQLEEGIGQGLMPAVIKILTPVNKWLSSSKNQEKITHAVTSAVHGLEEGVKAAIPIVRDLYQAADKVAKFLGGWKHALELLLAIKVVTILGKWGGAIDGLIGKRGGGGLAGAEGSSRGLLGNLRNLARIGTIAIGIDLIFSSSGDMSAKGILESALGGAMAGSMFGPYGAAIGAGAALGWKGGTALAHTSVGQGIRSFLGLPTDQPTYDKSGNYPGMAPAPTDKQWAAFVRKQLRGQAAADAVTPDLGPAPSSAQVQQAIALQRRLDAEADKLRKQAERAHQALPDTGGGGNLYVGKSGGRGRRTSDNARQKLIQYALSKLGDPYVWGAAGPNSFDCSGLVMWALSQEGVSLPHSTYAQVQMGKHVSLSNIQAGDVVFTNYGEGGKKGPGHEGLYIGGGRVEEAPHPGARVKIVSLQDFIGGGRYEIRDFLGGGHGKGLGQANTLLNLKMQGLDLEQTVMQTLGRLSDKLKVKVKNSLGTVIGTETVGEMRKRAEALLKVIETSTSPDQVRNAVKGLRELGRQAKGAVGEMLGALKTMETGLKTSATRALDLLLQVFDAKTSQMIQHAEAKVRMLDGTSFSISADRSDPNGMTPAEKQLQDMQDAHEEAARQQAIADARASGDQKALDDALYAETVAQLQKKADAERAAADKSIQAEQQELTVKRQLERDSFENAYQAILARVEAGTETAAQAQAQILKLMKKYGIDGAEATQLLGDAFGNTLARAMNKVIDALTQITNQLRALRGLPPIKVKVNTEFTSSGTPPPAGSPPYNPGLGGGRTTGDPDTPGAAAGAIFRAVPGGVYRALEGGAAESIISHDAKHRARSRAIWQRTGEILGFADGGIAEGAAAPPLDAKGRVPWLFQMVPFQDAIDQHWPNTFTWDESRQWPTRLHRLLAQYASEAKKKLDPNAEQPPLPVSIAGMLLTDALLRTQHGGPSKIGRATNYAVRVIGSTDYKNMLKADGTSDSATASVPPTDTGASSQFPPDPGEQYKGFSVGGIVGGVDRGRDTVLAGLRPGELILTPEHQTRAARRMGYTGSNAGGFLMARLGIPGKMGGISGMSGGGYVSPPPSTLGGAPAGSATIHIENLTVNGDLSDPRQRRQMSRLLLDDLSSELRRRGERTGRAY